MVLVLQPEADEIERRAEDFGDDREHQHVKKDRKEVMLVRAQVGPVAEFAGPACDQQHHQQGETDDRISQA